MSSRGSSDATIADACASSGISQLSRLSKSLRDAHLSLQTTCQKLVDYISRDGAASAASG